MNEQQALTRWRLVLGKDAEPALGISLDGADLAQDLALDWLYDRNEYGASRNVRVSRDRSGGMEGSNLTVPDWINQVHQLFPKRTIERIEKDALERYNIQEMVTNLDLLKRVQPSMTLLKAVLHTKHLMNQEVLAVARNLVKQMVEELMKKLARPIQSVFLGAKNRRRRSHLRIARNFDARTTIQRNLAHYNPQEKKLYVRTPHFFSRTRLLSERWKIIVVVDQSGSMVGSVIHAAVTAAIFFGIQCLRTHLLLFDTSVVDLTDHASDPVEAMMKVQLGGGTNIALALSYAAELVESPRRTIVVLISDFYEGGPVENLLGVAHRLVESGVTLLGLAALDEQAEPIYDRDTAEKLAALGAHVGAMTPWELAEWVALKVL